MKKNHGCQQRMAPFRSGRIQMSSYSMTWIGKKKSSYPVTRYKRNGDRQSLSTIAAITPQRAEMRQPFLSVLLFHQALSCSKIVDHRLSNLPTLMSSARFFRLSFHGVQKILIKLITITNQYFMAYKIFLESNQKEIASDGR